METATAEWTDEKPLPTFFAIIPADVRYHRRLSASAKLMFGEITSLANTRGFCYASNGYFERVFDCSERSVQGWLDQLVKAGFIRLEFNATNTSRRIYLTQIFSPTPAKKFRQQVAESCGHNDTSECSKENKAAGAAVKKPKTESKSEPVEIPVSLQTEHFLEAWSEWQQHRREKGHKLTPLTARRQIAMLEKMGPVASVASINQSIEKGWQGLFEPKGHQPGQVPPAKITPPTGLKPYSTQPTPGYDEAGLEIGHDEWERRFPLSLYYDDQTGRPMA
jgi:hypothetical protein